MTAYRVMLVLVERRWFIALAALIGLLAGAVPALLRTPKFAASFLVIPAPSDQSGGAQLGGLASTLGIRGLGGGGAATTTSPPFLARAARSREVLDEVVLDSIVVPELSGRKVLLLDLIVPDEAAGPRSPAEQERRIKQGTRKLAKWVRTAELKDISGFAASVTTPWPTVSHAAASAVLRELHELNTRIGQQGAAVERRYVQARIREQSVQLREAQDRQARFLRANREFRGSPELSFEFERLSSAVALHEQVLSQLLQSDEQAQLREVRDTPVLTVIEGPRVPVEREPRGTVLWGLAGLILGLAFGVLVTLARWGIVRDASVDPDAARLAASLQGPWRRTSQAS